MSTKIQLPDAMLDAISGGTVTYNGNPVSKVSMDNDGLTAIFRDGSDIKLKWNREIQSKAISAPGGLRDAMDEIMDKQMDFFNAFALEDYVE